MTKYIILILSLTSSGSFAEELPYKKLYECMSVVASSPFSTRNTIRIINAKQSDINLENPDNNVRILQQFPDRVYYISAKEIKAGVVKAFYGDDAEKTMASVKISQMTEPIAAHFFVNYVKESFEDYESVKDVWFSFNEVDKKTGQIFRKEHLPGVIPKQVIDKVNASLCICDKNHIATSEISNVRKKLVRHPKIKFATEDGSRDIEKSDLICEFVGS